VLILGTSDMLRQLALLDLVCVCVLGAGWYLGTRRAPSQVAEESTVIRSQPRTGWLLAGWFWVLCCILGELGNSLEVMRSNEPVLNRGDRLLSALGGAAFIWFFTYLTAVASKRGCPSFSSHAIILLTIAGILAVAHFALAVAGLTTV
jgi:hypothetical protein